MTAYDDYTVDIYERESLDVELITHSLSNLDGFQMAKRSCKFML